MNTGLLPCSPARHGSPVPNMTTNTYTTLCHLKTSAALALGAYLAAGQLHNIFQPHQPQPALHSVIPPLPSVSAAHEVSEQA